MNSTIRNRLQRLEQSAAGSGIIHKLIAGFKYIGGRHGVLKVPVVKSKTEWLNEQS
jgi:hypothetical protein